MGAATGSATTAPSSPSTSTSSSSSSSTAKSFDSAAQKALASGNSSSQTTATPPASAAGAPTASSTTPSASADPSGKKESGPGFATEFNARTKDAQEGAAKLKENLTDGWIAPVIAKYLGDKYAKEHNGKRPDFGDVPDVRKVGNAVVAAAENPSATASAMVQPLKDAKTHLDNGRVGAALGVVAAEAATMVSDPVGGKAGKVLKSAEKAGSATVKAGETAAVSAARAADAAPVQPIHPGTVKVVPNANGGTNRVIQTYTYDGKPLSTTVESTGQAIDAGRQGGAKGNQRATGRAGNVETGTPGHKGGHQAADHSHGAAGSQIRNMAAEHPKTDAAVDAMDGAAAAHANAGGKTISTTTNTWSAGNVAAPDTIRKEVVLINKDGTVKQHQAVTVDNKTGTGVPSTVTGAQTPVVPKVDHNTTLPKTYESAIRGREKAVLAKAAEGDARQLVSDIAAAKAAGNSGEVARLTKQLEKANATIVRNGGTPVK